MRKLLLTIAFAVSCVAVCSANVTLVHDTKGSTSGAATFTVTVNATPSPGDVLTLSGVATNVNCCTFPSISTIPSGWSCDNATGQQGGPILCWIASDGTTTSWSGWGWSGSSTNGQLYWVVTEWSNVSKVSAFASSMAYTTSAATITIAAPSARSLPIAMYAAGGTNGAPASWVSDANALNFATGFATASGLNYYNSEVTTATSWGPMGTGETIAGVMLQDAGGANPLAHRPQVPCMLALGLAC